MLSGMRLSKFESSAGLI